ncbi:MAG: response regulator transcription factor [Clostridiales bacterium]|jgi:DNA-binding response OmpR family regulator|nr:response regulator transcription factor [Clostridiales bacterium]
MDAKILIVDDDADMANLISLYLKKEGWGGDIAGDGLSAAERVKAGHYDLILMDVMMPGLDGFETLRAIRAFSQIPVIMLTARGGVMDRIGGFRHGADDYITKPFEAEELILRIKALLRRSAPRGEISCGPLSVNPEAYTVKLAGSPVEMAKKEIQLLALLMSYDKVFTREELYKKLWGGDVNEGSRTVDVHVNRIREKLGDLWGGRIKTVWNVGYRFEV